MTGTIIHRICSIVFAYVLGLAWLTVILASLARCEKCGRWCVTLEECERSREDRTGKADRLKGTPTR